MGVTARRFRTISLIGATLLLLASTTPSAHAAGITSGPLSGSKFTGPASRITTSNVVVPFEVRYRRQGVGDAVDSVAIGFDVDESYTPPATCLVPPGTVFTPESPSPSAQRHDFEGSEAAEFECNGRYNVTGEINTRYPVSEDEMTTSFVVAVPPASPSSLELEKDGSDVMLTWDPVPQAMDFAGYRVERSEAGGEPTVVGTTEETTFTDVALPDGDYEYRIVALRDAPDQHAASAPSPPAAVRIGAGSTTTTSTTSATTTTTVDGDDGGGNATGSINRGAGTAQGRSSSRTTSGPTTPTTRDTGFSDQLDYSGVDRPDDGQLAGAEVFYADGDGFQPRGLVKPLAGGMVLAMWGFHLRRLNRLARQPA